jgi:type II secretory pathway pseudopilin PulG
VASSWCRRSSAAGLRNEAAFSLAELLVVCAVTATILAAAMPQLLGFQEGSRGVAAARYVAARLQDARMEALKRSAHVAVAFVGAGSDITFAAVADGNGNGVRTAEIASGIDWTLWPAERLGQHVPGAEFGVIAGTPSIDNTGALTGTDPIRLGRSDLVSFSPLGSATPGTIYLLGPDRKPWAVRITGATGRVRLYEFEPTSQTWQAR